MSTDAFEMALVHRVFRNELRSAPLLIANARPAQRRRVERVADHVTNTLAALHHHHMAEDELLWPKLHVRVPLHGDEIRRMETEHELIAKTVVRVKRKLADWSAASCSEPVPGPTHRNAMHSLISEIEALAEIVCQHLREEEEHVVPLINENITDAEWLATTRRGGSLVSGHNIEFGLAFVEMTLEGCDADERGRFLAGMPRPQRLLVRLFGRMVVKRYRARLQGLRA
jgi:hemerythrin-like domain-containing protein